MADFLRLGTEVFGALNITRVVLIESEPHVIAERILERDGRNVGRDHLAEFIAIERSQAKLICGELGFPLRILVDPSADAFAEAISE